MEEQNLEDKSGAHLFGIETEDNVEPEEDKVEEPKAGMGFDTYEKLVEYYESYAKQEGFAVFKRSTSTTDDGEKRYGTLTCYRKGQRASRSKNQFRMKPTSGTNCKARLNVIIGSDGKCLISSLFLKHNHSLRPNKSRFFRSNRVINSHIKRKLEINDLAGIRPNKSYRSIVVEAGGPENVSFLEKDCRNFLDKVRRLRLGEGDATAVNEYFRKAPSAIITDQDKAMKIAIKEVFPLARHRWCLWHIMKKLPEKLKAHNEYDSIKFALNNAVYNSLSLHDFESSWNEMIEKYKLQNNDWLYGLYEEKNRWVPMYVKDCFWAGMSTTQRSESMNSFFDGYVNSKTTIKQFVEKYENALASKVSKGNQEDFNSYNSVYPCITDYEMEKELQSFYTNSKCLTCSIQ